MRLEYWLLLLRTSLVQQAFQLLTCLGRGVRPTTNVDGRRGSGGHLNIPLGRLLLLLILPSRFRRGDCDRFRVYREQLLFLHRLGGRHGRVRRRCVGPCATARPFAASLRVRSLPLLLASHGESRATTFHRHGSLFRERSQDKRCTQRLPQQQHRRVRHHHARTHPKGTWEGIALLLL